MPRLNLRPELADTGVLKAPTGEEVARLTLNRKYIVIDPYAFYYMLYRYAKKNSMRTPYQWLYQTFGKSGTIYPDKEVKSLIDDMERRGFLYKGSKYVIPLTKRWELPEDSYPAYVTSTETVAGLEEL